MSSDPYNSLAVTLQERIELGSRDECYGAVQ